MTFPRSSPTSSHPIWAHCLPSAAIEFIERVQCIVAAAVAECKRSDEAATLDALRRLIEAQIAALVREPRYQHTRIHAAELLDMSLSYLADLTKAGVIKVRREGGRCMILDTEVRRFLKTDSKKPPSRGRKRPPSAEPKP